jgi:hypothetical protein
MHSYHTLMLLGEARQADLLRQAQPQLHPVAPRRARRASIRAIARAVWPTRRTRTALGRAPQAGLPAKIEPSTSPMPATTSLPDA